jgi:hypothetical protein
MADNLFFGSARLDKAIVVEKVRQPRATRE